MAALMLVALLSIACTLGSGAVIENHGSNPELFVWQHQLLIISKRLHAECPNYIDKRDVTSDHTMSVNIDVAKELYNSLVREYVKCQEEKSKILGKSTTSAPPSKVSTTSIKADTTTTAEPTTTTTPTPSYRVSTTSTKADTTTTVEPTTTTTPTPSYRDCHEYYERGFRKSGVYMIKLSNGNLPAFNVWCDFIHNHGWTVIQRRGNQSVSFFPRGWNAYKRGFGDIDGEHWMGNERIHFLTKTNQKLNIVIISERDGQRSGIWNKFIVSNETDNYQLTIDGSGHAGNLTDSFSLYHNGSAFTTSDRDNDKNGGNCASSNQGGWWYNDCGGVYLNRGVGGGMYWYRVASPISLSVMRVTRY